MSSELPWGDWPYDHRTPAEVVHDFAVVRGDLSEQYARDQLSEWIERLARERVRRELIKAKAFIHAQRFAAEEGSLRGPDNFYNGIRTAEATLRELISPDSAEPSGS